MVSEGCLIWPLRMMLCLNTRSAVVVPLYKGKGRRNECSDYYKPDKCRW